MIKLISRWYTFFTTKNTVDKSFGFTKVKEAEEYLKAGKYADITRLYQTLKNDEKSLLVEGVTMKEDFVGAIALWLQFEPENPVANLFAGVSKTYTAWQIRSGLRAEYVSDKQFKGFFKHLQEAEQDLEKAISLDETDTEPFSRLIRVNMGLEDKERAYAFFNHLVTLDAEHLGGYLFMFNLLTPKWFGSNEEMEAFALEAKNNASNGLLNVIYLMYITERYNNLEEESINDARVYLNKHKKEILQIYNQIEISSIPSLQRYYLHNYFSYLFYLMEEKDLRNKEVDMIGCNIPFFPWAYRGVEGMRDMKLVKYA